MVSSVMPCTPPNLAIGRVIRNAISLDMDAELPIAYEAGGLRSLSVKEDLFPRLGMHIHRIRSELRAQLDCIGNKKVCF